LDCRLLAKTMISHQHKVIFVHIQKTGGTAIASAFGQPSVYPEKHFSASELRLLYGDSAWTTYFKFSFVRNPWDRLVSWWSNIQDQRPAFEQGIHLNKFQTYVLQHAFTFTDFLENCDEEILDNDGSKWIFRNQIDYLCDKDGDQMVDFIGRFESLQHDFSIITQETMGKVFNLPIVNQSKRSKYSEYYNSKTVDLVGLKYQKDIQTFGYSFSR